MTDKNFTFISYVFYSYIIVKTSSYYADFSKDTRWSRCILSDGMLQVTTDSGSFEQIFILSACRARDSSESPKIT